MEPEFISSENDPSDRTPPRYDILISSEKSGARDEPNWFFLESPSSTPIQNVVSDPHDEVPPGTTLKVGDLPSDAVIRYIGRRGSENRPSSAESPENPNSEQVNDMTRDELQAHLEANEAKVEQMTDKVGSKVDRLGDQIDAKFDNVKTSFEALEDKQTITRNIVIGVGTAVLLAVISLFIYALNQTNRVEDRVFENTQRIEQVTPETSSSSNPDDNSGAGLNQQ